MILIDTHTHLFSEKFENDKAEVVQNAINEGVKIMMLPNISFESIEAMMGLHQQFPENCLPMLGLHPCDVKEDYEMTLNSMKPLFEKHQFYGVGETGIDMHWDKSSLGIQIEALKIQIDWAKELNLPIIIHARESYDELFEVFDQENDDRLSGIFHCFTGSPEQAERILGYGNFKLGIGGVLTFKNSGLDKTVEQLDLKDLILETDSPYLAPHPKRGSRNESSYLIYIASKLAEVLGVSMDEVAKQTTQNAKEIFKLD